VTKQHNSEVADSAAAALPDESKVEAIEASVAQSGADKAAKDKAGRTKSRYGEGDDIMPAAGPHARPWLTNEWATPGAGALPGSGGGGGDEVEGGIG
jgi:hypothetical protein